MQFGKWMAITVKKLNPTNVQELLHFDGIFLEIQMTTYMIVGAQTTNITTISFLT